MNDTMASLLILFFQNTPLNFAAFLTFSRTQLRGTRNASKFVRLHASDGKQFLVCLFRKHL